MTDHAEALRALVARYLRHYSISEVAVMEAAAAEIERLQLFKTADYAMHEALDRTHLVREMLHDFVLNHPAVAGYPEYHAKAEEAFDALCELYQLIGLAHMENDK